MISREEISRKTEKAWAALHQRLNRDGLLPSQAQSDSRRKARLATIPAVVVVALSACIAVLFVVLRPSSAPMQTIHNGAEPVLAATLEDGSMVLLGEQTTVSYPVNFAKDKREVSLKGKAFFDVSKNTESPFFIDTEVAKVEVVGTSFVVECNDNSSFSLSVESGEVKVLLRDSDSVVGVKAGEAVVLSSGSLKKVKHNDSDTFSHYLSRVHFRDQRLVDIVRFINQHSDSTQIVISPDIEHRLLTVTLSDSSPQAMAELICVALNLHLRQQGNTITISGTN